MRYQATQKPWRPETNVSRGCARAPANDTGSWRRARRGRGAAVLPPSATFGAQTRPKEALTTLKEGRTEFLPSLIVYGVGLAIQDILQRCLERWDEAVTQHSLMFGFQVSAEWTYEDNNEYEKDALARNRKAPPFQSKTYLKSATQVITCRSVSKSLGRDLSPCEPSAWPSAVWYALKLLKREPKIAGE